MQDTSSATPCCAEFGRVLPQVLPAEPAAARLGGDEFVVMFPSTEADEADLVSESARTRLADGLDRSGFPVHFSAGLATYPYDGGGSSQLLRAADQALYEAKATRGGPVRRVPRCCPPRRRPHPVGAAGIAACAGPQRRCGTRGRRRGCTRDLEREVGRRCARPTLPSAHLRGRSDGVLGLARERRPPLRRRAALVTGDQSGRGGDLPDRRLPADEAGARERPLARDLLPRQRPRPRRGLCPAGAAE